MLHYTTPAPTPHLLLHLRYEEADPPVCWTGHVQELPEIHVTAYTFEWWLRDIIRLTNHTLQHNHREAAFALLRQQGHEVVDTGQQVAFSLLDDSSP